MEKAKHFEVETQENMEKTTYERNCFFIHPAVQGTYIALSVVPAVLATLFCTYVLIYGGESVLRAAKEGPLVPLQSMRETVQSLEKLGDKEESAPKLEKLKWDLVQIKLAMEDSYDETVQRWDAIRWHIFAVMFWCLMLVGAMALLFSHRVAGPLFRIGKCIDAFAAGKDSGPVRLRKRDQYKDLAISVERLRKSLVQKGVLQNGKDKSTTV